MDIHDVCSGLADRARSIRGVTAYDHFPLSASVPAFIVAAVNVDYDATFNRGGDNLSITCGLLVSKVDDKASSRRLYDYISGSGPSSVKAVIEAEPTLGGACDDLTVETSRIPRVIQVGDKEYWAAEFTIEIDGDGL